MPWGAVMPPPIGDTVGWPVVRTSASKRCERHERRDTRLLAIDQGQHERVLTAATELWTRDTVARDLLRHPGVRHNRETHPREVGGIMGKHAELFEAGHASLTLHFRHQLAADAQRPCAPINDERAHFCHSAAEWRQFGAAYDAAAPDGDDESMRVKSQLVTLAGQKPSLLEMCPNQRVQCRGFFGCRRTQDDVA